MSLFMLSRTLNYGMGAGRQSDGVTSSSSRSAFTNRDTATATSGSKSVKAPQCWYTTRLRRTTLLSGSHNTAAKFSANHGKQRPSHHATARTSEQPTHHARTSAAHGRSPSKSKSPPRPTSTATSLDTLTNCLPSPSGRTKATSNHRSPVYKPRCPRSSDIRQQQWPLVLARHGHPAGAKVPEVRRV